MRGWRAACSYTPLSDTWEPDSPEVAIGEFRKFGLRRTESSGLPGGSFADKETVPDVVCDGLH